MLNYPNAVCATSLTNTMPSSSGSMTSASSIADNKSSATNTTSTSAHKDTKSQGIQTQNGTAHSPKETLDESIFASLKHLYSSISLQKKQTGVMAPTQFINKLRKTNGIPSKTSITILGFLELFRSTMHQDAHEFLNFLLNTVAEDVESYEKAVELTPIDSTSRKSSATSQTASSSSQQIPSLGSTWIHSLFQGVLTSETRCLSCETVTNRDEAFLDLSIDISDHTSVTYCLKQFAASEMLRHRNKFHCDQCASLQEAEKRMKIKRLPKILALHLKRFKYQEKLQRYVKLAYRVVFPLELRVFDTCEETELADRLYRLFAIVVHIGMGPHHGHYVAIIRSGREWILFDDDNVDIIPETELENYYGDQGHGSSYVLFYEAVPEKSVVQGGTARDGEQVFGLSMSREHTHETTLTT